MKIIYLTNAMLAKDFEKLIKYSKSMPNPSNQNFHSRFVSSLSTAFKVKVISQRPANHQNISLPSLDYAVSDNYYYPGFKTTKIIRNIELYNNSKQIVANLKVSKDDFVFVDLLNQNLTKLAKHIKKHYKTNVIGILTDNPSNLTGVKKDYVKAVLKDAQICDGFVCLTPKLNELINTDNKPFTLVPGVVSNDEVELDEKFMPLKPYIFFAGALYERYGIRNLVEAVINEKRDYKLVIAGHGPMSSQLAFLSQNHPRLIFLGAVKPLRTLAFAKNALINVNPRLYDQKLEDYSVPSKVIEYASTGVPLLSTRSNYLEKVYKNSVFWTNEDASSLRNAIDTILDNYQEAVDRAITAREISEIEFGNTALTNKIKELIEKLK